jgi:hypothetical protein
MLETYGKDLYISVEVGHLKMFIVDVIDLSKRLLEECVLPGRHYLILIPHKSHLITSLYTPCSLQDSH